MHTDTPIKVRYGETDMMGVVYHANYLLYFEDARLDFLEALDFSYSERIEQAGYMSPIHSVEIRYHRPLRYGEEGFVRTTVVRNQPMKTVYHQQVFLANGADTSEAAPDDAPDEGEPKGRVSGDVSSSAVASDEPAMGAPLVDAFVTVCVVERATFKPVSIKRTFPDLYRAYGEALEEPTRP